MFPVTDKAQSVVDALLNRLKQLNVTIRTNEKSKKCGTRTAGQRALRQTMTNTLTQTPSLSRSAENQSRIPAKTGDGYAWAEAAGHTVTELFPTEVPVTSSEPFIKQKTLQGLSLRNAAVSVLNKKANQSSHT